MFQGIIYSMNSWTKMVIVYSSSDWNYAQSIWVNHREREKKTQQNNINFVYPRKKNTRTDRNMTTVFHFIHLPIPNEFHYKLHSFFFCLPHSLSLTHTQTHFGIFGNNSVNKKKKQNKKTETAFLLAIASCPNIVISLNCRLFSIGSEKWVFCMRCMVNCRYKKCIYAYARLEWTNKACTRYNSLIVKISMYL